MAAGLNKFPAAHDDAVAAYEWLFEIDPLRSGGDELAKRLNAAKVDVDEKTWDGVAHEFFGMGAVVSDARDAESWAAKRLRQSLGT